MVLAMFAWSVKSRSAPSRHCRDVRVYGHTTTAMHDMSTPPPLCCLKKTAEQHEANETEKERVAKKIETLMDDRIALSQQFERGQSLRQVRKLEAKLSIAANAESAQILRGGGCGALTKFLPSHATRSIQFLL